jgi:NAD(P)-dependent dehydrogenase (short-subunit alcohol dehydrogenase family)
MTTRGDGRLNDDRGGAAPSATSPSVRTALVTGAGSGIGRAVALELAAAGWSVTLVGRRPGKLEETARLIERQHGCAPTAVPADVADPEAVTALFTSVRDRCGRLDLLFNNAGTFGPAVPLEDLSHADWQRVLDVNLTGAFLCAQAAFRLMKDQRPQGGRIINNGSVSAHTPRPGSIAYTATKHAVTGLTKSLSLDGRPYGIACGQIDIGNAATTMTERMQRGVPQADGTTAAEPVMDAADVARTVLHMAQLPAGANVQFATVLATTMPYIGRG